MNPQHRLDAIELITNVQADTAPVRITIGSTDPESDIVQHDTLFVNRAPPRVLDALREAGFSLAVEDDGVRVDDYAYDPEDGQ